MAEAQRRRYVCQACGSVSHRWQGQCADCAEWNTLVQEAAEVTSIFAAKHNLQGGGRRGPAGRARHPRGAARAAAERASPNSTARSAAGSCRDRRCWSAAIPGIGKSTLLLQVAARLAQAGQQRRLCLGRGIGRAGAAARGPARARRRAGAARGGDLGARYPDHGRRRRARAARHRFRSRPCIPT